MIDCYVYTCGYMAGPGSPRKNWRRTLEAVVRERQKVFQEEGHEQLGTIGFLHPTAPPGVIPGQGDPNFYAPRDIEQVRKADIIFAYADLEVHRFLGSTIEMGIAYERQTPIILVDKSPEVGSLDLNRFVSSTIWPTMEAGVDQLIFVANGLTTQCQPGGVPA